MTQLQELSTTIAKQSQQISTDSKALDVQTAEVVRLQDEMLAAKTKLQQMRTAYHGLTNERDSNLGMLRDLSRVALGEYVPLQGDKEFPF